MSVDENEIVDLRNEVERLRYRLSTVHDGIADVCELLGHEGRDVDDLRDAVGQIERLARGKDLGDKLAGLAEVLRLRLK